MNKQVTLEEAKGMLGTEFLYIYPDGETVRGYVKAFDLKVGLTCFSLETEASRGWTGHPNSERDPDGTWCLIGFDFSKGDNCYSFGCPVKQALKVLTEIRDTGKHKVSYGSNGSASCAF
jgi:hypothetical protein